MKIIDNYNHKIASHCETGSVRNLLGHAGLEITEPMVFGIGSGPAFYYLFFAKGLNGFPLIGIRNPPGSILKNVAKYCRIEFFSKCYKKSAAALGKAHEMLDEQVPVAAIVDMFYMKYLPSFLHVHAPFHTILLVGREEDAYFVSDPYFEEIGRLEKEDLLAAWETHAPMAKDNFLAYVKKLPPSVDWRRVVKRAIRKTCDGMLLPPVVKKILAFVGVEGMHTYAKKIPRWPDKYRGAMLREGIMFNAVGFEEQGTGGGAFRLMYGAFLQEIGQLFNSSEMEDLAGRVIEHGQEWRNISRKLIRVGKPIPLDSEAYDDWYSKNGSTLRQGLGEISELFKERAEFERRFFGDLKTAAARL